MHNEKCKVSTRDVHITQLTWRIESNEEQAPRRSIIRRLIHMTSTQ